MINEIQQKVIKARKDLKAANSLLDNCLSSQIDNLQSIRNFVKKDLSDLEDQAFALDYSITLTGELRGLNEAN